MQVEVQWLNLNLLHVTKVLLTHTDKIKRLRCLVCVVVKTKMLLLMLIYPFLNNLSNSMQLQRCKLTLPCKPHFFFSIRVMSNILKDCFGDLSFTPTSLKDWDEDEMKKKKIECPFERFFF